MRTRWPHLPSPARLASASLLLTALFPLLSACPATKKDAKMTSPRPPVAATHPHAITKHGDTRQDPYYWMRDRKNPETIRYLEAENAYAKAIMAPTEAFQKTLYDELIARIKQTDLSVPYQMNGYWYYSRTEEGKSYPIYCRKKGALTAAEEILLDVNKMAVGKKYMSIGTLSVSPNGKLLAFSYDERGNERYTLRVKNLETGALHAEAIPDTGGSIEWGNDNATIFYTRVDATTRPYQLFRHVLGQPVTGDAKLFEESDGAFYLNLGKTRSGKYIVMALGSAVTDEVHVLDADAPRGALRVITPRRKNVEYSISHHGGHFYITTNDGGATNFKLMRAPVATPGHAHWQEVIAHDPAVYLRDTEVFRDHLVLVERRGGLTNLRVRKWADGSTHDIPWSEPVYTTYVSVNRDFNTTTLRLRYTSLTTPSSVFDYDMNTRVKTLKKEQPVLGGYDRTKYVAQRVEATAADGTKVPISIVYKKGARGPDDDQPAPLLLRGYGSYGISSDPYFSSSRLSLLDRGVVIATAHVRGGGELGRLWYESGKYLNKKNTFTDFIACAEHLTSQRWTTRGKLAIWGGSAGGMLMGAVANMRPELFQAVVADVPFVDVVTTMLDTSIPLTETEWEEWGNPNDPTYYRYMKSYSPYDNVRAQAYPHMLITAGLNDPRVAYWEPAKWTARLRTTNTGDRPILLKTNMGAGHGGASGRYERYREIAFQYAFVLDRLGLRAP